MIKASDKQKTMVSKYLGTEYQDIDTLLEDLDEKITEIGFDENFEFLNETGIQLQTLFDQLLMQNS
ncbi:hypothetical protein [Eubacterium pyruvativorans]|uniref:hypothetical protein n=1 Tax=Eubacterium pyruvativorans TaxID=155865 RepID=UPI000888B497|nr:hypothetical protein [Eubacterium pyruvativorans]SDF30897.1 hypothetical protein SAMN04487889_11731 [Eubacterium pyruvativorans]